MRINTHILFILAGIACTLSFMDAQNCGDAQDWEDILSTQPGYELTSVIKGGIVLKNGEQMGDDGDIFAAFDESCNIRGIATQQIPNGGPFSGEIVYEMTMGSDNVGDLLHFKYYEASKNKIHEIAETYTFINNVQLGNLIDPKKYNIAFVTLSFSNATTSSIKIYYNSNIDISGFQFNVEGVTLEDASGGDAEENDLSITASSNTVIAYSLTGSFIPAGDGTLVFLDFVESSDGTLKVSNIIISDAYGSAISNNGPLQSPPLLFSYNSSTLQAFYLFNSVIINGALVDSDDWVGAFKGDVCVGARKWDTSQCNSGVCDVPVMGDWLPPNHPGGPYPTEGYMDAGDIPTFKIYDASTDTHYNAVASEEFGWADQGFNNMDFLNVNMEIRGCMDNGLLIDSQIPGIAACNYNNTATVEEDNSCDYSCIGCTDYHACNYKTEAEIDYNCLYAEENYDCYGNCSVELDCNGICGGTAVDDDCGICGGNNSTCPDCAGVSNGNSYKDNCNECDDDPSNDCEMDCKGNWCIEGSVIEDDGVLVPCLVGVGNICSASNLPGCDVCGTCGGSSTDATNDCCEDMDCVGLCFGVDPLYGNLVNDDCGVCRFPNSDVWNSTCEDCAGVTNGSKVEDNCGTCDDDSSNDCVKDCVGIWGGSSVDDECGVCNGDGPEENYDCYGQCIAELDCNGICGGSDMPDYNCANGDIVCNLLGCLDIQQHLLPDDYGINRIFPNPFNPIIQIEYNISRYALVKTRVFDIQGREVAQLMNEYQNPGQYFINWDAGNHVSGMYIVEMVIQSGDDTAIFRDVRKILYLK